MRKRIQQLIASSPHLCMLLLCCFFSQTALGQQLEPQITSPGLQLLYSLFLCTPVANTAMAAVTNVPLAPLPAGADLVITDTGETTDSPGNADNAQAEMQDALFDTETEMLLARFAEMIDEDPDDLANTRLYTFIDEWYGVKYRYGGTDGHGIDCSAFSQKLYALTYGINLLRTSRQQYHASVHFRQYDEATEGDLVFFRIKRLRISHVGVYLANGYFVHASRSQGVMISNLADKYWRRRYAGCGRIDRPTMPTESGAMVNSTATQ